MSVSYNKFFIYYLLNHTDTDIIWDLLRKSKNSHSNATENQKTVIQILLKIKKQ